MYARGNDKLIAKRQQAKNTNTLIWASMKMGKHISGGSYSGGSIPY
jgi:hypothetical protein